MIAQLYPPTTLEQIIKVQCRLVVGTEDTELDLEIKANLPFYGEVLLTNEMLQG